MAISPILTARGYMKANAALLAGVPLEQAHNTLLWTVDEMYWRGLSREPIVLDNLNK